MLARQSVGISAAGVELGDPLRRARSSGPPRGPTAEKLLPHRLIVDTIGSVAAVQGVLKDAFDHSTRIRFAPPSSPACSYALTNWANGWVPENEFLRIHFMTSSVRGNSKFGGNLGKTAALGPRWIVRSASADSQLALEL